MKRDKLERLTVEFSDGIELIVERRGKRVFLAQRIPVLKIDGSEEFEEWEIADGEIEGYFPDLMN